MGEPTGSIQSLKTQISRWENGKVTPDAFHRKLLRSVLGVSDEALGFTSATTTMDARPPALAQALTNASLAAVGSVDQLRQKLAVLRRTDGQQGATQLLDYGRGLLREVTQQRRYLARASERRALAAETAGLASLVGWQSLDLGDVDSAWTAYEEAKAAAREAEDSALLAHTSAEQSFTLLDLGRGRDAADMVADARTRPGLPPRLVAWLYAAEAECLAAAGDASAARAALNAAELALPASDDDAALTPYLRLDAVNLARWRGHSLSRLQDPGAVGELLAGLGDVRGRFGRAEAGVLVDLAAAEVHRRHTEEARQYLRAARAAANRAGSVRQHRRLEAITAAA